MDNPLMKFYDEIEIAKKYVNNVESILDGYRANKNIPNFAVKKWMTSNTHKDPNFCKYYPEKILKELCEKPGTLKTAIINPLKNWLDEYKKSLKYETLLTLKDIKNLARDGIKVIYNFIVITFFFATNPQYLVENIYKVKHEDIVLTKKLMLELLEEFANCTGKLNRIYERMNSLIFEKDDDLEKMRSVIKFICTSIRLERLRMN